MVADKIDMSLDDIIANNRRSNRGGRGRGGRGGRGASRGGRGGQRGTSNFRSGGPVRRGRGGNRSSTTPYSRPKTLPDRWEHDKYDGAAARSSTGPGRRADGVSTGTHLQIANLDFGVTESDIKELFSEFGKLKKAIINYDGSGRSHGTADVVFERKADAIKACHTYNGVPLDGRPMKIEVVTQISFESNTTAATTSPARRRFSGGATRGSNSSSYRGRSSNGGFRGNRGGRGRGGNRGGRREQREVPSKDELDKELDSYVVKGNL